MLSVKAVDRHPLFIGAEVQSVSAGRASGLGRQSKPSILHIKKTK